MLYKNGSKKREVEYTHKEKKKKHRVEKIKILILEKKKEKPGKENFLFSHFHTCIVKKCGLLLETGNPFS